MRRGAGLAWAASHLFGMWQDIFDLQVSAGEKVLRAILIYLFLIAILRIVGKRELGQANTLDLVVLLLVANAVQNGIIGNDVSVTGAVIGAVTLFALNEVVSRTTYALPWAARALEGEPTLLVAEGKPIHKALRRSGISLPELRASARRQGFADLGAVHTDPRDERHRDDVQGGRARLLPPGRGGRTADRQASPRRQLRRAALPQ